MEQTIRLAAAGLVAAAFAAPAIANPPERAADFSPLPPVVANGPAPGSPIHAGADNAADTALARQVASALAADPRLEGATITVSAKDGDVMISGSAEGADQGDLAQQVARSVTGAESVTGTLSPAGG